MLAAVVVIAIAAYLLGSIPTGYLVGRARGLDLRTLGSGNIGATNALRVLGKPAGTFVLLVDALKGWAGAAVVPSLVIRWLGGSGAATGVAWPTWLPVVGGVCAVLGHNFTCWLRFRGGKGIATSAGVLAALLPFAFFVALAVFLGCLLVFRIVSLGSIAAAASLPLATWYWHREPVLVGFSIALAALAIWRHRANIQRLLAGTEPRLGQKRVSQPPASTS